MFYSRKIDYPVREHIPLEQGLRRHSSNPWQISHPVREHIPLEQGLRLTVPMIVNFFILSESIFH